MPNLGCIKGVKQLQIWCCVSPMKWLQTVGSGVIILKKHHFFSPKKMIVLLFQPVSGLHMSHSWFSYLWLWIMLYSQKAESSMHSFWKKWGDSNQVTGFSFPGCSDALNFYQLRRCCAENHCLHFHGERAIVDMLPVWLFSLWVEIVAAPIYHTIFLQPKPIFLLTLVKPLFNFFNCGCLKNFSIFMNDFVNFLLFSFWVAVTGLPDSDWSLRSTVPWFSQPVMHSTYFHSVFTIKKQWWWEFYFSKFKTQ